MALFGGCNLFAFNWKLPAYSGAFLLTIVFGSFFIYRGSFPAYNFLAFFLMIEAFLLTMEKCV